MCLLAQHSALVMVCEYHNVLVVVGTGHHAAKQARVNLASEALLLHTVYSGTILILSQERRSLVCPNYL